MQVPDALKSTLPIGEVAGVILLTVFGIRALQVCVCVFVCVSVCM